MAEPLPLLLEPATLAGMLGQRDDVLLVDLSKAENHAQYHVPGSVHLDYASIIRMDKPVMGLLPETADLERVLGAVGIGPDTHVVAFDDEGGGKAARLLWTLDCLGHHQYSLLDGGLLAWANEGLPTDHAPTAPTPAAFQARPSEAPIASTEHILEHLNDPGLCLFDNRSPAEFCGEKKYAARGGHIPGAINWDWAEAMDQGRHMRLKPLDQLRASLAAMGVTPDKEVVCYCQTHHRSSLIYVLLRILGYPKVKGYPGAWSDWGNRNDTPVEA
jgi:thiosulfate/3-mercaptopyruvate sulfurtransferase